MNISKVKLLENGTRNWLAEAVGNYTTNMKCTWVVEANKPDSRIRLHIKDFETECGWDHLYVWDGDNIFHGLQVSVLYGLGIDYVYKTRTLGSKFPTIFHTFVTTQLCL